MVDTPVRAAALERRAVNARRGPDHDPPSDHARATELRQGPADPRSGGALFYARLFAIDPSTRALFRGDVAAQGAKLMAAIGTIVRSLDRIEPMLEHTRALARRHVGYGVREEHYASVGAALLWTLEQGLGAHFTDEVRGAWAAAYQLLSSTMIEAASQPAVAAA
jgi:hemoglobin-like flavoprotein